MNDEDRAAIAFYTGLRNRSRPPELHNTRVIYLDQCVISRLSRGELPQLFQQVATLATSGHAVFPLSSYHRDESAALDRFADVYGFAVALSGGWFVRSYWGTRAYETLPAFARFVGKPYSEREDEAPISRVPDWHPYRPERIDNSELVRRLNTELPENTTGERSFYFRNELSRVVEDWQLDLLFGTHPRSPEVGPFFPGANYLQPMRALAERVHGRGSARECISNFFDSPWYRWSPSRTLEAAIWASWQRDTGREWKLSDDVDSRFAATVTPYVNAVVVDKNLAEVVARGFFQAESVFPGLEVVPAKPQAMLDYFTRIVQPIRPASGLVQGPNAADD